MDFDATRARGEWGDITTLDWPHGLVTLDLTDFGNARPTHKFGGCLEESESALRNLENRQEALGVLVTRRRPCY